MYVITISEYGLIYRGNVAGRPLFQRAHANNLGVHSHSTLTINDGKIDLSTAPGYPAPAKLYKRKADAMRTAARVCQYLPAGLTIKIFDITH